MGKLIFGKNPSMNEKTAMATNKGYDSGKPSIGSSGPAKVKVKPTASNGSVGVNISKKF